MLQNAVPAKIIEVEAVCPRVVRAGSDGLQEKDHGITVCDVESVEHGILEDAQGDTLAIPREVAMVGKGVKARARPAGYRHVNQRHVDCQS